MAGDDPAVQAGVAAGQQASALGRSQMQAQTAVGMGMDNGQPGVYVPFTAPYGWSQSVATSARRYYTRFVAPKSLPINSIGFFLITVATADDPVEVALYSAAPTRLATSGSVLGRLNAGAATVRDVPIPTVSLVGGQVYLASIAFNAPAGTAAQVAAFNGINNGLAAMFGTTPTTEEMFVDTTGGLPLPTTPTTSGPFVANPLLVLKS